MTIPITPGKELVGRNARLEDGVYRDDYIAALNQFASVDEVFGEHRQAISKGDHYIVGNLVMGTLGRTEWENHLVSIVMNAAQSGEWRAVLREPRRQTEGLDAVTTNNYGHVVEHEGRKFLLPSALYVTYCQAKLELL